jgi:putative phosphoesterase
MKIFFVSDIHGSLFYANKAVEKFKEENADVIVLLGDVLYHGPRNPLPKDYNPAEVADLLNQYKDKIIAVRGNCDSEVDQMVLSFPMMGDYHMMVFDGYKLFITHGHLYNKNQMPNLVKGDAFIHGHFHLPMAEDLNGISYLNPGSITLPKENNPNSYAVLDNDHYIVKDLEGNVLKERRLK